MDTSKKYNLEKTMRDFKLSCPTCRQKHGWKRLYFQDVDGSSSPSRIRLPQQRQPSVSEAESGSEDEDEEESNAARLLRETQAELEATQLGLEELQGQHGRCGHVKKLLEDRIKELNTKVATGNAKLNYDLKALQVSYEGLQSRIAHDAEKRDNYRRELIDLRE